MIHTFQSAMWFIQQALEWTLFIPPSAFAVVLAAVSLTFAGRAHHPLRTRRWRPRYWYALTHLLFFFAAIAVGITLAAPLTGPSSSLHPNRAGTLCVDALLWGSFASCAFWIWRMKGFRWFAMSLMALLQLPVLGALSIAGISVTGDWI